MFLDWKAYIMNYLAGIAVTDLASASGTGLLNIHNLKWDPLVLEIAGIDEKMLPQLEEGTKIFVMTRCATLELGLKEPIDIVLGLFDGWCMVLVSALLRGGIGVVNMGTSAMLRTVIDSPIIDRSPLMRFQTYYLFNRRWLSGGAINNAGLVLEWLINTFL